MIATFGQSTWSRMATKRPTLVNIEDTAITGTTFSAPMTGTSTSGSSSPVP